MNLWEKILSLSNLPECRSIAQHICGITQTGGVTTFIPSDILKGALVNQNILRGNMIEQTVLKGELKEVEILKGALVNSAVLKGELKEQEILKGKTKCQ